LAAIDSGAKRQIQTIALFIEYMYINGSHLHSHSHLPGEAVLARGWEAGINKITTVWRVEKWNSDGEVIG
jgi:hypothetical protein